MASVWEEEWGDDEEEGEEELDDGVFSRREGRFQ